MIILNKISGAKYFPVYLASKILFQNQNLSDSLFHSLDELSEEAKLLFLPLRRENGLLK